MAGPDSGLVLVQYTKAACGTVQGGGSLAKYLTQTLGQRAIRVVESTLVVVHLAVSLTLRRWEAVGDGAPDVLQSTTSSTLLSFVVQVSTLPQFLDKWRSNTLNRFVLNMVKDHHLQIMAQPVFCNFHWFNT